MPTRRQLRALRRAYKADWGGGQWGQQGLFGGKNRCQRGAAVRASGQVSGHCTGTRAPPGGGRVSRRLQAALGRFPHRCLTMASPRPGRSCPPPLTPHRRLGCQTASSPEELSAKEEERKRWDSQKNTKHELPQTCI